MISIDELKNPIVAVAAGVVILALGIFVFLHGRVEAANAVEEDDRHMRLLEERVEDVSPESITARSTTGSTRESNAYDGATGFVVPYRPDCPAGAARRGGVPPDGFKEWCVRVGANAGIKHGWYTTFFENGRPQSAGEYRDGLKVGVWTRWHENGKKRVQAEFANGLQHGRLISWNERGVKLGEQHFANGSVMASRD